ncbi:hypothetical protein CYMTET_41140 [Cymbomonas tetramitiformis]|uniref:Myb-like domain-containing protein n=1 Tax=Cymbomonas tetramitiformis TaxID=36881 RepID=A0AAE0F3Y4_9CHLO|nr:hypothetical protein CYMTET_41140 [Cymbomonas tetramitiformis]
MSFNLDALDNLDAVTAGSNRTSKFAAKFKPRQKPRVSLAKKAATSTPANVSGDGEPSKKTQPAPSEGQARASSSHQEDSRAVSGVPRAPQGLVEESGSVPERPASLDSVKQTLSNKRLPIPDGQSKEATAAPPATTTKEASASDNAIETLLEPKQTRPASRPELDSRTRGETLNVRGEVHEEEPASQAASTTSRVNRYEANDTSKKGAQTTKEAAEGSHGLSASLSQGPATGARRGAVEPEPTHRPAAIQARVKPRGFSDTTSAGQGQQQFTEPEQARQGERGAEHVAIRKEKQGVSEPLADKAPASILPSEQAATRRPDDVAAVVLREAPGTVPTHDAVQPGTEAAASRPAPIEFWAEVPDLNAVPDQNSVDGTTDNQGPGRGPDLNSVGGTTNNQGPGRGGGRSRGRGSRPRGRGRGPGRGKGQSGATAEPALSQEPGARTEDGPSVEAETEVHGDVAKKKPGRKRKDPEGPTEGVKAAEKTKKQPRKRKQKDLPEGERGEEGLAAATQGEGSGREGRGGEGRGVVATIERGRGRGRAGTGRGRGRRTRVQSGEAGAAEDEFDLEGMSLREIIQRFTGKDKDIAAERQKTRKREQLEEAAREKDMAVAAASAIEAGPSGGGAGELESQSFMAPQLQIDPITGEMTLITDSLTVQTQDASANGGLESYRRVEETTTFLNSSSFTNRLKPERWSKEETDKFYEMIKKFGTDLTLINIHFPNRQRPQLKRKFKIEDKQNPARMSDAIACSMHRGDSEQQVVNYQDALLKFKENQQQKQAISLNAVAHADAEAVDEDYVV